MWCPRHHWNLSIKLILWAWFQWKWLDQWKKGPWLFRLYRGWNTNQLYDMSIIISHYKGPLSTNQDSMESRRFFFWQLTWVSAKKTGFVKHSFFKHVGLAKAFRGFSLAIRDFLPQGNLFGIPSNSWDPEHLSARLMAGFFLWQNPVLVASWLG